MKKRFLLLALIAVLALSFATVLSACNKQEETGPVKIENPKDFDYDGTYITWADALGAATYEIVVDEGEPVTSKSSTFKFKATEDKFTVSVTAKAAEGSEEYLDSDTVTKIFDKIAAVENVEFADDATMTWNTVSGATGYVVEYNNGTKTKVTDCVFAQLPAGKYSVKVKAIRDSEPNYVYYTENPVSTTITVLASVVSDKITYDGTTIKWNAISSAVNYKVIIDESEIGDVPTNSMTIPEGYEGRSFNVKILALGDPSKKVYNASEMGSRNFIYLAPATNLSMDEGVLTWDAVDHADGYEIKIIGKGTKKVIEPKFSDFTAGESISLQIRAYSNDNTYYAGWTNEATYLLLDRPDLKWDDKRLNGNEAEPIYWNQVPNATGYLAVIEGPEGYKKQDNLGVDGVGYGSDFAKAGTYTVKVKSLADKNNVCDSVWSLPITVVRLASPKLAAGEPITSKPNDLSQGFTVTFVQVPEATDYRLYKNGVSVKLSGGKTQITEYMNDVGNQGDTAAFTLQAVGRSYNDKKVVLDSLYTESESFPITVLATPSIDVEPITGMTYNFGKVSGTSKYTIKLDGEYDPIDDGDDGYDLSGLSKGNHKISVNARGDGKTTLSSKYTAETNVSRLAAPDNVRINTENGNAGNLYFDPVTKALSYEYTLDGQKYDLKKDQIDNIANKIGTDTKLFVKSNGNYYDGETYYMDSLNSITYSFTKLRTPDVSPNNALKGTKLIWSTIDDFNQFKPTYRVVNSKNLTVKENIDVGELDLNEELMGGQTETFYVYAIGNGTKYINSDTPVQGITITRLSKPDVKIDLEEKAYAWDYVSKADEFQVYVDGVLKVTLTNSSSQDKYYYHPDFKGNNTYNVEIIAVGNSGNGIMQSPKFEKSQKTEMLSTPTFTYSYDKEVVSNDGNILINVTSSTEGVLGYAFIIAGSTDKKMLHYYGSSNDYSLEEIVKYSFNAQSTGEYSLDVYAIGGNFVFDESINDYVVKTNSSDSGAVYSIYLLAFPNGINLDTAGVLTWGSVPNAKKYKVSITVDGQEYIAEPSSTTLNIKTYLKDKGVTYVPGETNVTIKIQAINTNSNYVNSQWSPEIQR